MHVAVGNMTGACWRQNQHNALGREGNIISRRWLDGGRYCVLSEPSIAVI